MKKIIVYISGILTALGILAGSYVGYANPSYFAPRTSTATATTTVVYMSPGNATTTLIYDANDAGQTNLKADELSLAIQLTASSSQTKLVWRYEFADDTSGTDCKTSPNACDWYYQDRELSASTATTSIKVGNLADNSWQFASSTAATVTSVTRGMKIVSVPAPTRYVKTVFYLPAESLNGAIWARYIPAKQKPE